MSQSSVKPNWNTLDLPAGRTIKAAQLCYQALKKEASKAQMVSSSDVTPSKHRKDKDVGQMSEKAENTPKKDSKNPAKRCEKTKGDAGTKYESDEENGQMMGKGENTKVQMKVKQESNRGKKRVYTSEDDDDFEYE